MKHFCSFSEAIREGAKLRPQGRGFYLINGQTCAMGAGIEAIFGVMPCSLLPLLDLFPYLDNQHAHCPACQQPAKLPRSLDIIIYHLNDDHGWTREQIADWLESEEEKLGYVTVSESVESPELTEVTV